MSLCGHFSLLYLIDLRVFVVFLHLFVNVLCLFLVTLCVFVIVLCFINLSMMNKSSKVPPYVSNLTFYSLSPLRMSLSRTIPPLLFHSAFLSLCPTNAKAKGGNRNTERLRAVYLSWWNRHTVQYYSWINPFTRWEKTSQQFETMLRLIGRQPFSLKSQNNTKQTLWLLFIYVFILQIN